MTRGRALAAATLAGCALEIASCASLPPATARAIAQDREFASRIQGRQASFAHRIVFGGTSLDGRLYLAFIDRRVRETKGEGILWASCHGALACGNLGSGEIRVSDEYASGRIPPIARFSYLIHEAVHAQGGPDHDRCPDPFVGRDGKPIVSPYLGIPLAAKDACDSSSGGGYVTQIIALGNIARFCEACAPEERSEAAKLAQALAPLVLDPVVKAGLVSDGDIKP